MKKLSPIDSLCSLIGAPVGPYQADMYFESCLHSLGHRIVAGVDEAGRGPLAGPVVAAAVILDVRNVPDGLNDSKKLTSKTRAILYEEILQNADVSIASMSARQIDEINIRQATLSCMSQAVSSLAKETDWCLIDGRDVPTNLNGKATAIIKGDGRSLSVAAASIIAKVTRDNIMSECAKIYPEYGFDQHKGYGTKIHRQVIAKIGPCALHRFSFAPIRND